MNSNRSADTQAHRAKWQVAPVAFAVGALLLFIAGCESEPESHVVSAPPPAAPGSTVTVATPQPGQAVAVTPSSTQSSAPVIIAQQAPPPAQQEVVTAQPTPEDKWIPGYWTWRSDRYQWVAGHWERPPHSGDTWVPPRWEQLSDGTYRFYEGYWQ